MGHVDGVEFFALSGYFFDEGHVFVAFVVGAFGELTVEFFYFLLHLVEVGEGLRRFFEDGATILGHQVLRQICDDGVLGSRHFAACRLTHAGEDFKQSRFTRTVFAHQRDTIFVVDDERDVTKKSCAAKLYGKSID